MGRPLPAYPSGDSSPMLTKRWYWAPPRKEFKSDPELETKEKFVIEGIMLHKQRCGLLSESGNETLSV